MKILLLPCPFCGGEAALENLGIKRKELEVVIPTCQNQDCRAMTLHDADPVIAAVGWNRRVRVAVRR